MISTKILRHSMSDQRSFPQNHQEQHADANYSSLCIGSSYLLTPVQLGLLGQKLLLPCLHVLCAWTTKQE